MGHRTLEVEGKACLVGSQEVGNLAEEVLACLAGLQKAWADEQTRVDPL